jgi:hypothetical protein
MGIQIKMEALPMRMTYPSNIGATIFSGQCFLIFQPRNKQIATL